MPVGKMLNTRRYKNITPEMIEIAEKHMLDTVVLLDEIERLIPGAKIDALTTCSPDRIDELFRKVEALSQHTGRPLKNA